MAEKEKKKWYKAAWNWAYKHGLTPLNKRFWAIAIIGVGVARKDTATIGVGLGAMGAGEYHALTSEGKVSNIEQTYQKARGFFKTEKTERGSK